MREDARRAVIPDLLHSCADPCVARAALASIGGAFAERVRKHAGSRDMSAGVFAARSVAEFARRADAAEIAALDRAIDGVDLPLLEGLRTILDRAIGRYAESGRSWRTARAPAPDSRAACCA